MKNLLRILVFAGFGVLSSGVALGIEFNYTDVDSFGITLDFDSATDFPRSKGGNFNIYNNADTSIPFLPLSGINGDSTSSWTVPTGYTGEGTTYTDQDGFSAVMNDKGKYIFQPGAETATYAEVFFYLRDNDDPASERVRLVLSGNQLFNNEILNGAQVRLTATIFDGTASVDILADINDNGQVSYSVYANSGSFIFDAAVLQVKVPEAASTFWLLGTAFAGLVALGRLVRSRN